MISVIVYGRNDNHGYNLHKRCSISLNCIAHLLDEDDDEILFVDYNTPDDMPTFIEAISDTLTRQARSLIRILRVRPRHHARIANKTHLVAVEPIARNVAIRRSNPNNRWVLSTNTDMIFIPRRLDQTLSTVCAGLVDGFYHLPRFELPEALWESCSRATPRKSLVAVRRWANRFHLDEVVYGNENIIYDGPGDFQLALRNDLFEMNGFDERMILGWHVDSNIAKRFRLLRGRIETALPHLKGYHCDHTRQATIYHRRDRVENDSVRFVDQVERFEIPEQAESWGFADEAIEEIRVGQNTANRYLAALSATIKTPQVIDHYVSAYNSQSFDDLDYSLEHVLPYLVDSLYCVHPKTVIGYIGCRSDTFAATVCALQQIGFCGRLLVCQDEAWLHQSHSFIDIVPLCQLAEYSEIVIAEVGREPLEEYTGSAPSGTRIVSVFNLFEQIVHTASANPTRRPKKAIGINVVHNQFERLFNNAVSVTLTPYGSRVRHGFIQSSLERTAQSDIDIPKLRHDLSRRLGRRFAISVAELAFYREELLLLLERPAESSRLARSGAIAMALCELLTMSEGRAYVGITDHNQAEELLAAIERASAVKQLPQIIDPLPVLNDPPPFALATRIAEISDWEDDTWVALLRRFFGDHAISGPSRKPWTWERVSALHAFMLLFAQRSAPNVLLVAHDPDCLAVYFAMLGAVVEIIDPAELIDELGSPCDWSASIPDWAGKPPTPIRYVDDLAGGMNRYDLIVFAQNSFFAAHIGGVAAIMGKISPTLKQGGHALIHASLRLDHLADSSSIAKWMITDGLLQGLLEQHTDFQLVLPSNGIIGISRATLERSWFGNPNSEELPSFVWWDDNAVQVRMQLVLQKREPIRPANWNILVTEWARLVTARERPVQSVPVEQPEDGLFTRSTNSQVTDDDDAVTRGARVRLDELVSVEDGLISIHSLVLSVLHRIGAINCLLVDATNGAQPPDLASRDSAQERLKEVLQSLDHLQAEAASIEWEVKRCIESASVVSVSLSHRNAEISILSARVQGLQRLLMSLERDAGATLAAANGRVRRQPGRSTRDSLIRTARMNP